MSFSWSNKRHDKQPQGVFRQQPRRWRGRQGQNMTEYMLVFAAAVVVMIAALNPKGLVTKAIDKSINMMFDSVEDMTRESCLGTIDDVNGGWSNWSSWGACAGCVQTRTRGCTNPSPKCNGIPCSGPATETQTCPSGTWVTGICGTCTGDCGDTAGSCTRLVTCLGGCCTSPAPASVLTCTKAEYPDEWNEFGFVGSCSTTCGQGIASQTVTCSGMCCDAKIKPHTRRACTDGCCAESLYAYTDVGTSPGPEDDTPVTANFGPTTNGQPFSVSCPFGYDGNPTRTCTATANLSCTGNDSYVPPPSCYNIGWSAVTNQCVPADCLAVSVDAGHGRTWDISGGLHDTTATLTCSDNGWHYTGSASYDCWLGTWRNLNAGCIPNCLEQTLGIGSGQTGLFLEKTDGEIGTSSCPCGYSGSPQRQCDEAGNNLGEWGNLIAGTECAIKRCGEPGGEKFPVLVLTDDAGNPVETVEGTFGPVDHLESSDLDCQTQIDSRLEGTASMDCDWCANALNGWTNPRYSCIPRHCEPVTGNSVDMGAGVKGNLPKGNHNEEQTLSCAVYDPRFTGESKYKCVYGEWTPLSLGCGAKDCVNWTTNIGGAVSGTFTGGAGSHGVTRNLTCNAINPYYKGTAGSTCCYGDWYAGGTICASVTAPSGTNVYSPAPACVAFACQNTYVSPPVNNATSCGDDTSLTADENWSVVNTCTTTKTCEYQCNQYYYKSDNACSLAVCDGSAPGSANVCSGDESNLTAAQNGTLRHLVSSCAQGAACDASKCTAGDKCEYYCPGSSVVYGSGCCTPACPAFSCGTQNNGCGGTIWCGSCCGNGAIDTGEGEVCDTNGPVLNGKTCYDFSYTGNCGSLGCGSGCGSFDTSNCKNAVDGTWGGSWVDVGGCNSSCQQLQQQRTCVGALCGGTCSGAYPEQYVGCFGGGSCCNDDGTCDDTNLCTTDTCDLGTWTCGYTMTTCLDNGTYCDGIESCDPINGNCVSAGNPCLSPNSCFESIDQCCCYIDVSSTCFGVKTNGTCATLLWGKGGAYDLYSGVNCTKYGGCGLAKVGDSCSIAGSICDAGRACNESWCYCKTQKCVAY